MMQSQRGALGNITQDSNGGNDKGSKNGVSIYMEVRSLGHPPGFISLTAINTGNKCTRDGDMAKTGALYKITYVSSYWILAVSPCYK